MKASSRKKVCQRRGGRTQSQKRHYCPLCEDWGQGPRYEQFHLTDKLCGGQGVKNFWSKVSRHLDNRG